MRSPAVPRSEETRSRRSIGRSPGARATPGPATTHRLAWHGTARPGSPPHPSRRSTRFAPRRHVTRTPQPNPRTSLPLLRALSVPHAEQLPKRTTPPSRSAATATPHLTGRWPPRASLTGSQVPPSAGPRRRCPPTAPASSHLIYPPSPFS